MFTLLYQFTANKWSEQNYHGSWSKFPFQVLQTPMSHPHHWSLVHHSEGGIDVLSGPDSQPVPSHLSHIWPAVMVVKSFDWHWQFAAKSEQKTNRVSYVSVKTLFCHQLFVS
jgi:hypothetical protein